MTSALRPRLCIVLAFLFLVVGPVAKASANTMGGEIILTVTWRAEISALGGEVGDIFLFSNYFYDSPTIDGVFTPAGWLGRPENVKRQQGKPQVQGRTRLS